MNSCEDFFELVTKAHIIVAAMKVFKMKKIDDKPDEKLFPLDSESPTVLQDAVKKIVSQFVDLSFPVKVKKRSKSMDHVLEYGKDILTMGLLLLEFKDTIKHGAGFRILRCWKFMFLFFSSNRSYKLYTGIIQLTVPLLLLTATSICRAIDMESFCEHSWLLW